MTNTSSKEPIFFNKKKEKSQVKLQAIKFVSYCIITKYFVRIGKVPTSSHFHHRFFSCKDFWLMCIKRSWRCDTCSDTPHSQNSHVYKLFEVQTVFLTEISASKDQYSCFHWVQIVIETTEFLGLPACLFWYFSRALPWRKFKAFHSVQWGFRIRVSCSI